MLEKKKKEKVVVCVNVPSILAAFQLCYRDARRGKCAVTPGGHCMLHHSCLQHGTLWVGAQVTCSLERTWTNLGGSSGSTTSCVILDKTVNFPGTQRLFLCEGGDNNVYLLLRSR